MALRKASKQEEEKKEEVKVEETPQEETKPKTSPKKKEEPKEIKVEAKTPTKQPNVRIKPKQDIRTYIGDQWYNLKAGKVETVPQQVKEILQKAGLLELL